MVQDYYNYNKFIWSGWQYGNITFENDTEINVDEIRELLDDDGDEELPKY